MAYEELALQGLVTALVALPATVAGVKASMNGMRKRQEEQGHQLEVLDNKMDDQGQRLARLETTVDLCLPKKTIPKQ